MKNILVTGANGQLGSELRKISGRYSKYQFVFTDVEDLDLSDSAHVQSYFIRNDFSYCLNCAAYTAVDKAETDIENAISINVGAVRNLAEACFKSNTLLFHISTDFVFDGSSCRPYVESDKARPINVYGQSKYEGENQVVKENPNSIIIRTSWLYSEYGNNFVKNMLRVGNEKDAIGVVFDQIGSPTYANDLAVSLMHMVEYISGGKSASPDYPGIYHYSNEGVTSWYDFAREIFSISGMDCEVSPLHTEEYPTPAKRPYFSVLDKTKIKTVFGLRIPHWKDSLIRCLREMGY